MTDKDKIGNMFPYERYRLVSCTMERAGPGVVYKVEYSPLKRQKMTHALLRYSGFKPQSMSKKQNGTIKIVKDAVEARFESDNCFSGSQSNTNNIFVLIRDHDTKKFRLEKISSSLQLKKTFLQVSQEKIEPILEKKISPITPKTPPIQQLPVALVSQHSMELSDSETSSSDSE